ncbi:MAG: hypothetical protein ABIR70_07790 [Bryobacteraceae bacterium]
MTELETLLRKHRNNGLLIDTNLFLLYLVGLTNPQRIATFDRTQQFGIQDFRLLARFAAEFKLHYTTPHVLTEVSNLARLKGTDRKGVREHLREIVTKTTELMETSQALVADESFLRLGLTDAAIIAAAKRPLLILTDDLDLYLTLRAGGFDAINFNHIRTWN